eukprot:3772220-Rhodomonas_salina.1
MSVFNDSRSIVVADTVNQALRVVDASTGQTSTLPASVGYEWFGVAAVEDGSLIVATVRSSHTVYLLDTRDNALSLLAGGNGAGLRDGNTSRSQFRHPQGVAISVDGTEALI